MRIRRIRSLALAALASSAPLGGASAHCAVGNRFFPATLNVDDPCVADELSLPTISSFKTADQPAANELDISGGFSKRITEDLAVSAGLTWSRLRHPGGPNASGFANLETAITYQIFRDAAHEFAATAALDVEWGRTGAQSIGSDRFNTYAPTINFGKASAICPTRPAGCAPSR